jgi:L-histidine Nalpha-methyltransferase
MTTQTPAQDRLRWIDTDLPKIDDGSDVIQGLTQTPKTLPCKYFYDDSPEERLLLGQTLRYRQRGSELFEQITDLPEYYPTRTEQAILETYVSEIIALTGACEPIELGSGSSRKTHTLLTAYSQLPDPLHYYPIDVSAGILRSTALDLLATYPQLNVCGVAGT